jgi:hypothetical protein
MRRLYLLLICSLFCKAVYADPLQDEIQRWKTFIDNHQSTEEDWTQFKPTAVSIISRAESNRSAGRRYYAFYLLAAIRPHLAAEEYLSSQSKESLEQMSSLEAEWKKWGATYQDVLSNKNKPGFEGVPAAIRGSGEAAFSEIRPYYEASVEYGKATMATYGFYYLGSAKSQREFTAYCEQFRSDPPASKLNLPGLKNELDSLEDLILENYKPPASIDQHPVFIRTSATLKSARELYDSQSYDGSLLKMLDARVRFSKMLNPGKAITPEEAQRKATEFGKRLQDHQRDESIARLFIEMAIGESLNQDPEAKGGETARAVFEDALPHYFSALETPRAESPKASPVLTVTLVRWPYT